MIRLIFGLSCALCAANLCAADVVKIPMQPGLWEITTRMQSEDPELTKAMEEAQRAMDSMPESQRKMMQEMLQKQGVQMSAGAPGETKVTMCMTEAMVNQGGLPQQQSGTCNQKTNASGSTFNFEFTCTEPASSGTGTYTFSGDSSYTMAMNITTGTGSSVQQMTLLGNGKLVAADCGDVKPLGGQK